MSHWTWRTCDCRGEYTKTGACYLCAQEGCGECVKLSVYWGGPKSDKAYLTCGDCRETHGGSRCICGKVSIDEFMERYLAQQAQETSAASGSSSSAAATSSSSAATSAEVPDEAPVMVVGSSGTMYTVCSDCRKHGDLPIVCEEALHSAVDVNLLRCEGSIPLCLAIQRKCCASIVCRACDEQHQTSLRRMSQPVSQSTFSTKTTHPWEDIETDAAAALDVKSQGSNTAPFCCICKDTPLCPVCADYHFLPQLGKQPLCPKCPMWKRQVTKDLGAYFYEDVARLIRCYVSEDPMQDWYSSLPSESSWIYYLPHTAPTHHQQTGSKGSSNHGSKRACSRGSKHGTPDGDWTRKHKKKRTTLSSSSAVGGLFK